MFSNSRLIVLNYRIRCKVSFGSFVLLLHFPLHTVTFVCSHLRNHVNLFCAFFFALSNYNFLLSFCKLLLAWWYSRSFSFQVPIHVFSPLFFSLEKKAFIFLSSWKQGLTQKELCCRMFISAMLSLALASSVMNLWLTVFVPIPALLYVRK